MVFFGLVYTFDGSVQVCPMFDGGSSGSICHGFIFLAGGCFLLLRSCERVVSRES